MKRLVIALLGLSVLGVLVFFAVGYEMVVDEAQLQQKINAKLPFSKNYYVMFRGTLDHADVHLGEGKVYIRFDAHLSSINPMALIDNRSDAPVLPILSGSADIIATPDFHPETGQVFLTQVKVVGMDIKSVSDGAPFKPSVKKLALAYLAKHPIYTLRGNNFKKMLARDWLKAVTVKDHALVLSFGI